MSYIWRLQTGLQGFCTSTVEDANKQTSWNKYSLQHQSWRWQVYTCYRNSIYLFGIHSLVIDGYPSNNWVYRVFQPTWQNSSFTSNFPQFWIENSSFTCNFFPQFCQMGRMFKVQPTRTDLQTLTGCSGLSLELCPYQGKWTLGLVRQWVELLELNWLPSNKFHKARHSIPDVCHGKIDLFGVQKMGNF